MKILIFDGYLGRDAEVKTSQKGTQFLSFRVGNTTWVKGENKTEWIEVMCFNANTIATTAQYLKKGSHVCITGTPDTTVNPGKDGRLYVNTSVLADRIEFIGGASKKDKDGNDVSSNEPEIKVNEQSAPATNYAEIEQSVAQTVIPASAPTPAPANEPDGDDSDELPF